MIQIRSLFIQFTFQFMQIKAFLSGEEGTNGVCDLLPRFFSELFGKHRALLLPSPAALSGEFFASQVWSDPLGEAVPRETNTWSSGV